MEGDRKLSRADPRDTVAAMDDAPDPLQIAIYRRMTPAQKFAQAQALYWSARALKEAAVRQQHPDWSDDEVKAHVRTIFLLATT